MMNARIAYVSHYSIDDTRGSVLLGDELHTSSCSTLVYPETIPTTPIGTPANRNVSPCVVKTFTGCHLNLILSKNQDSDMFRKYPVF